MHEPARCSGGRVACDSANREISMRATRPCSASRILDPRQIRRLIGFSSVVDLTIQRFHGAP